MRASRIAPLAAALFCACGGGSPPSDDPSDYPIETGRTYVLQASPPRWVVPSPGLPPEVTLQPSNNNLDLELFEDRMFFVWRTGPTHWASPEVELHVVSSEDEGLTWVHEETLHIGADLREPRFVAIGGALHLYYFEAGTEFYTFSPQRIWRITRRGPGDWSTPEVHSETKEVLWDTKVRGGVAYMGSYIGNHYLEGEGAIDVFLKRTTDGVTWSDLDPTRPALYHGGVSEIAYELDEEGGLWVVTRNEDGDATGFGSHVCYAPPGRLSAWECPERADPERYDSPKLFRHGREIYAVARRDLGGPYDLGRDDLPFEERRRFYQAEYWTRPKRTAIYRIDREAKRLVHLFDLPSAGDTAYPAVRRTGPHTFLVANYTSPLHDPDRSWVSGQSSEEGTQIYFTTLTFTPE